MTERKIWKNGLSILMIFQIVVALSLAIFAMGLPQLTVKFYE